MRHYFKNGPLGTPAKTNETTKEDKDKDSRVQDGTVSAFSVTGYSLPQQNKPGSWCA